MLIKKVCSCRHFKMPSIFIQAGKKISCLVLTLSQAVAVRKHLERNRKDKDSKFRLILIESRIHRLSRYYKSVSVLPPNWRYESATASTMVA
jgi:small subunit ribosomal protein S13e